MIFFMAVIPALKFFIADIDCENSDVYGRYGVNEFAVVVLSEKVGDYYQKEEKGPAVY